MNQNEDQAHPTHTRDPKVWKDGDTYYMVLGSTYREEVGRAVFYTSHDGINWKFKNQVQDKRFGRILECPDIFEVDGVHVFEGSAMYIADGSCGYENHAICATAEFDREQCNLRLTGEVQYVDYGMDLYAPQTNLDHEGRRVMIAWMRMPQPVTEAEGIKWNGMMCLPRVVEVENGHVCYRVHPEVRKYFNEVAASSQEWNPLEPFCIKVCLEEGEKLNIGGYQIQRCDRRILTDRSKVFADLKEYALTAKSPKVSGECRLEIFVDRNLVEIYINDGEYVISQVVYGLTDIIEVETDKNNITYLRHNSDR